MVTAVADAALSPQDCAHTWLIAPPNGSRSIGHCPRCNAQREFYNSIPDDKRVNNSDIFTGRRGGGRQLWNEDDADLAVRSMYRR